MQLWHGTADPVVSYSELAEEIKQWTNVHDLSTTPTSTDTPQPGWTRQRFADSTGAVPVEAISVSGAGHSLPMSGMAAAAVQFFGLTTGAPTPTPPLPGSACSVTYTPNTWNNGFTATVTLKNTGTAPVNGWSLTWTWSGNQQITSAWSTTISQSGADVTARNVSYNAAIAPGASIGFGFQATYSGTNTAPTRFALNGGPCD
jgi:cellulase/cellobiase CelA1